MLLEEDIINNTPIFIYDANEIRERANELIETVRPHGLYYSVKANCNSQVLNVVSKIKGINAEVCSIGELKASIRAGFEPGSMVYGGPGKTKKDIQYAISAGVRRFSIESINELLLARKVEGEENIKLMLILRILSEPANNARLNMMRPDSKFGITLNEIRDNREILHDLYGVHLYFGTQCDAYDVFDKNIKLTNTIVSDIEGILGNKLQYINYGGGLHWPYLTHGKDRIPEDICKLGVLPREQVFFEFGRYLVASSGVLFTTVLDVKFRDNKQIVILDAGIQTLAGISATGRLLRPNLEYYNYISKDDYGVVDTAVYGPLCTPADYFTLNSKLPRVSVGDVVYIPNAGAYGFATGMQNFLMRKKPTEKMINDK